MKLTEYSGSIIPVESSQDGSSLSLTPYEGEIVPAEYFSNIDKTYSPSAAQVAVRMGTRLPRAVAAGVQSSGTMLPSFVETAAKAAAPLLDPIVSGGEGVPVQIPGLGWVRNAGKAIRGEQFDPAQSDNTLRIRDVLPENPLRRIASGAEEMRKASQATTEQIAGSQEGAGRIERGILSGGQSFGAMLPGMAATVVTGNPSFALGTGSAQQGADSATKALDEGKSPMQAINYGAQDAVAEWATEKIPVGRLLKDLKAGAPFLKTLGHQILTETPSEVVATAWQNFNEWANLHPDKSIEDFAAEQPGAAADTVIATITQSVMTAGLGHGVNRVANGKATKGSQLDEKALAALIEQRRQNAAGAAPADPSGGNEDVSHEPSAVERAAAPSAISEEGGTGTGRDAEGGAPDSGIINDGAGLAGVAGDAGGSARGVQQADPAGSAGPEQPQAPVVAAPPAAAKPLNWFSFLKERGVSPAAIRKGTPEFTTLKAEYDALKAAPKAAIADAAQSIETGESPGIADARDQIAQAGTVSAVQMADDLGITTDEARDRIAQITGRPAVESIGKPAQAVEAQDGRMLIAPQATALQALEQQVAQLEAKVAQRRAVKGQAARQAPAGTVAQAAEVQTSSPGQTAPAVETAAAQAQVDQPVQAMQAMQAEQQPAGDAGQAEQPGLTARPFDHGELNIPGRTNNINRDIDRYKRDQAAQLKIEQKARSAKNREDTARAIEMFSERADEMVSRYTPGVAARRGITEKQAARDSRKTLERMAKTEPARFIKFVEQFDKERTRGESESSSPSEATAQVAPVKEKPSSPSSVEKARPEEKSAPASTKPNIETMSRDEYAAAKRDAYVASQGGKVPARVADGIYQAATAQWNRHRATGAIAEDGARANRPSRRTFHVAGAELELNGVTTEDVYAAITPMIRAAQNLPPVTVLQSPKQLKDGDDRQRVLYAWLKERGALSDAAGTMHGRRIYLFTENIRNIEEARAVLLHEGAHYGLRGLMDEDTLNSLMDQIRKSNPWVADEADRHVMNYGTSITEATEEVLANWAGRNDMADLKGWPKIVAIVREHLRRMGFVHEWTNNDVIRLLQRAQQYWLKPNRNEYSNIVRKGTRLARGSGRVYPDEELEFFRSQGIEVNDGRNDNADQGKDVGGASDGRDSAYKESAAVALGLREYSAGGKRYATLSRGSADGRTSAEDFERVGEATGHPSAVLGVWFSSEPADAERYGKVGTNGVAIENPAVFSAEDWPNFDTPEEWLRFKSDLQAKGHDSIAIDYRDIGGPVHVVAFDHSQLDSSSQEYNGMRMARAGQYLPEQEEFRMKAGIGPRPTIIQKVERWFSEMRDSLSWDAFRQGALDQFHGIKLAEAHTVGMFPVEQSAYVAARLATGASSVMAAILNHGQARWAANGQHLEKIPGTKGLLDILKPVEGHLDDWLGWMVANRAQRLMREGRENNFTADDIKAGLSLAAGRETEFKAVAKEFAEFKRSVLDVAEKAGMIDPAGRQLWDHADWIPFYRQMADDTMKAPGGKRGLSQQTSGIRQLTGGESAMNDPLENILLNFHHLIDASLKNNALRRVIQNVESGGALESVGYGMQGVMIPRAQVEKQLLASGVSPQQVAAMPAQAFEGLGKMWALHAPQGKDIIRVMDGGRPHFYRVTDPLLLKAVTSFEPINVPGLTYARVMKRVLTRFTTATPPFMVRNFVRDSLSSAIISRDRTAVLGALRGAMKSWNEEGGFQSMMFAGASFAGGQADGADPEATAKAMRRALRSKGFSAAAADGFIATVWDTAAKGAEQYFAVSEAIENANREAIFEATKRAGGSETAAAFEALDLMDFRLRGSSALYQIIADVVPFVNARVQGLYRLGRSDMKQVAVRGAIALMLPSILLALANAGNDDYEELPDWDKDTYWHFFIGDHHFRIPKPFEVGVIFATIPERITRASLGIDGVRDAAQSIGFRADASDSPQKLAARVWFNISDQFNLVQWPQFMKPVVELGFNKDGFSGRPIETQGDEEMQPSMRFNYNTSDTMKALAGMFPGASDFTGLSPKRLEHLWNGYLGSVGGAILGVSDFFVRRYQGLPYREAIRLDEYPLLGVMYRESPAKNSQYVEDIYKMAAEATRLKKSIIAAAENPDRADEILQGNEDKVAIEGVLRHQAKAITQAGKMIEKIRKDPDKTADQKRKEIDEIYAERNARAAEFAKQALKVFGGSI